MHNHTYTFSLFCPPEETKAEGKSFFQTSMKLYTSSCRLMRLTKHGPIYKLIDNASPHVRWWASGDAKMFTHYYISGWNGRGFGGQQDGTRVLFVLSTHLCFHAVNHYIPYRYHLYYMYTRYLTVVVVKFCCVLYFLLYVILSIRLKICYRFKTGAINTK